MDQKDFLAIHGWVDDILHDHAGSGYLLRVRQDGRQVADLALDQPFGSMRLEDEVSVVVVGPRPGRVLALIDHTTGEGANLVGEGRRRWPGTGDLLLISATIGSFAVVLGWVALPASLYFVLLYWLVTHRIPEASRRFTAARIDYLIDREYCLWQAMRTRQGSIS